eukprot:jgi/Psemu1/56768/gm1.56768_g
MAYNNDDDTRIIPAVLQYFDPRPTLNPTPTFVPSISLVNSSEHSFGHPFDTTAAPSLGHFVYLPRISFCNTQSYAANDLHSHMQESLLQHHDINRTGNRQSNLNAVFSRILPNVSSLFIVDDDGVKTLPPDPIPVLKSLIVAAIMDELPPLEVSKAQKRHISSLIAKTTIFWHSKAIGGRIRVRDKQVLDIAAKHAKRGRPIIQLVLNIIQWKFHSEWYPYEFHKVYNAADGIPLNKTGSSQILRTQPTAPVVSETLPVPSRPTIVPSGITDLVPTKTTVPIPCAGASPVTANSGPLQPVGPIADTPSVKAPHYIWTWTYSPKSQSVSFRRIRSDSLPRATSSSPPVQRQEKSSIVTALPVTPSKLPPIDHHSAQPWLPANFRWTFNPQSETVTFHRLPKPAPVPLKPPSRFPLSATTADDPVFSCPIHSKHREYSSCLKPNYQPVLLRLSKRHRDALSIQMYHLYANILSMSWFYDPVD